MTDEHKTQDRRDSRIQSLDRAFSVLEEVARHRDGITLSELSRELGLHTSTLYHLARTLVSLGYLRTGPDDKRYRMGRGIFQLASACLDEAEICATVAPYLERLAETTGEATHFAIWERRKALILARHAGPNALQINERAGTLRPVYCTAIGKALLSGLGPETYEDYTRDLVFEPYTASTLKDAQELRLQVDKARRDGIAFDDCEFNAEVRCMAATVRDFTGKVIGAIGFSGPVWRMSLTDMADYTSVTRSIAAELSEQFGFRPKEVAPTPAPTKTKRNTSHGND
ncbi:IclR family transcriptional regulator [Microbaculum marinisediminis]|uniref:IclR family transcriptional regulator n=1 Tax=Microbaculum marinisediminis TaxID=2931392 RepID=A0AAW5R4C3_9HYPH|nr:IclR family transcriptional regulator [Microbaculum sp. A6E488]MCT8973513.1 IclR family transcriptional regulator [Microbaculum sp. A6E488]